jgi:acetyltransferase-like isoleucine patch superfamily enzyme
MIKKIIPKQILYWRDGLLTLCRLYIRCKNPKIYGYMAPNVKLQTPIDISNSKNVYFYENTGLHGGLKIINWTGKFIVKKFSSCGAKLLVVTGNHTPTVGVPQILLGPSHINDKETDIVIEEDVWIGASVTLLAGAHIGRGAVVGACSLVNKEIPPYAIAVGCPVKIIASKLTAEQILEHEKVLYPADERFSKEYLEQLFKEHFVGKKSIGTSHITEEDRERLINIQKKRNIIFY